MDATELRRQKIVAKAQLDSLVQLYEHGSATKEDVDAQRKIWEGLKEYSLSPQSESPLTPKGGIWKIPSKSFIGGVKNVFVVNKDDLVDIGPDTHRGLNFNGLIVDSSLEEAAELEEIRKELHEIDMLKNAKCNELASKPRDTNQKALVDEIKALRVQYINKSDEIYYFKRHGERVAPPAPDGGADLDNVSFDDSEYVKSLPRDKVELWRLRKNMEANLSKYKGRLEKSKTDVKKAAQRKNISIANIKLNTIDQLMATL